jgi:hypothetical protein
MRIFIIQLCLQLLLAFNLLQAQPYSAYVNDRLEFYILDRTEVKKIDYLQPFSYKIGANSVAYIDNTKNFKIYRNGKSIQLAEGYTDYYFPGTQLLTVSANQMLYVFNSSNEKTNILSTVCNRYVAGDSIVAFYDSRFYNFNYYQNGQIIKLEDGIIGDPVENLVAGDNILAYNNVFNNFKIVYRGEVIEQDNRKAISIMAAANTVAYVDGNNAFNIFYKGETFEVSPFLPKNFFIGDNLVAFTDNTNQFNIFYDGKTTALGNFNPTYIKIVDNMLVYSDATKGLSVFYKGDTYRLENFIPQDIMVSSNSISYIDASGRIQFFSFGKNIDVEYQATEGLQLDFDVLRVQTSFNTYRFYYKDKIFE